MWLKENPLQSCFKFNYNFEYHFVIIQRRFSSANRDWDSDERDPSKNDYNNRNDNNIIGDNIELVECHTEPASSIVAKVPANGNKPPKLNTLPTLSVSGPSPPHDKEEFL